MAIAITSPEREGRRRLPPRGTFPDRKREAAPKKSEEESEKPLELLYRSHGDKQEDMKPSMVLVAVDRPRPGKEAVALHLDKSLRFRAHLMLVRPGGLEDNKEGCWSFWQETDMQAATIHVQTREEADASISVINCLFSSKLNHICACLLL